MWSVVDGTWGKQPVSDGDGSPCRWRVRRTSYEVLNDLQYHLTTSGDASRATEAPRDCCSGVVVVDEWDYVVEERSAALRTLLPEHGAVRDDDDGLGDAVQGELEVDGELKGPGEAVGPSVMMRRPMHASRPRTLRALAVILRAKTLYF